MERRRDAKQRNAKQRNDWRPANLASPAHPPALPCHLNLRIIALQLLSHILSNSCLACLHMPEPANR